MLVRNIRTISGSARGRAIGSPTINLDLSAVPEILPHGIYACWIIFGNSHHQGAMHYGPRPVFDAGVSMEVHVLDQSIGQAPETVDLDIVKKIRDVKNFPSVQELQQAIASDIDVVRGILASA